MLYEHFTSVLAFPVHSQLYSLCLHHGYIVHVKGDVRAAQRAQYISSLWSRAIDWFCPFFVFGLVAKSLLCLSRNCITPAMAVEKIEMTLALHSLKDQSIFWTPQGTVLQERQQNNYWNPWKVTPTEIFSGSLLLV